MSIAPLANDGSIAVGPSASRARSRAQAIPSRERARRRLVGVVLFIYLLLIFEGSLRKWVLPQLSLYLFFIRDPFLLYAYVLATIYGLWPKSRVFLTTCIVMAGLGLLIGVAQLVLQSAGPTQVMLTAYGWRNYFLYAPLAFLIGSTFSADDLLRVCRWTMLLCVPIGVLVAIQFFAAPTSAVNVGLGVDPELRFFGLGLTAEHTRPMGPFSSGSGQIQFAASAFALLLGLVVTPARSRGVRRWVLWLAALGVATCLALSGSRAAVLHCALIALSATGLVFVGRSLALKWRAATVPLLIAVFIGLYPLVFPQAFDAFAGRWQAAAKIEDKIFEGGVYGRALYGFVDFTRLIGRTPVLGYGLGMGGNASTTLGLQIDGADPVSLAETDWARHIVDLGPIFGVGYILFRIALTLWLGLLVFNATRRGAGALPLVLFAFAGYVVLLGQLTGQGAINGYGWLFAGFCIAASTSSAAQQRRKPSPTKSARVGAASRGRAPVGEAT